MPPTTRSAGPSRAIVLPLAVRQRVEALGVDGLQWAERLPDAIAALERDWDVRIGATLAGGSEAYVAEAVTADGELAVVKLRLPHDDAFAHEVTTLDLARGRGYPRLIRYDAARSAVLLERLGPTLDSMGLAVDAQIRVICDTLRVAWVPIAADLGFPTCAEKALSLVQFIEALWHELERPCSERVVDRARAFADLRHRAFDPDNAVLIHGDAHAANTLRGLDSGSGEGRAFKLVDPDGLFGERAYDLAIPMRGWSAELLAGDALNLGRRRCAYLSALTGVDAEAIWQWGFVERVSTGLLLVQLGRQAEGRETLAVAEQWVRD